MSKESILIIGGGLCGSLLCIRLAQRGYRVRLMEGREDLRKGTTSAGRSINLAFSDRGIKAMELVGISEKVVPLCIPMKGRMIHEINGSIFMSNYSGRETEYINSISRGGLNSLLLSEAEKYENVTIQFNMKCTSVNLDSNEVKFFSQESNSSSTVNADVVIGTDGAASVLRNEYFSSNRFLFNFSREFLRHGYKELSIPPTADGKFRLPEDALHIWPRGNFMLIALPNLDASFTVTLFLSYEEGEHNFSSLNTEDLVHSFFSEQFPDAYAQMPDLAQDFLRNPVGALGTVKCSPWHHKGKSLIMGDAAHAIVPFYGQGMNASFEDVVVLDSFIDRFDGNWEKLFTEYEQARKKDTDAIADLAVDNYYEMRDHVADDRFKEKRKLEMLFEKNFPTKYFSKYSMVTFREDLPYSEAMRIGRAQDQAIIELLKEGRIDSSDTENALKTVLKRTDRILNNQRPAK